jgi:hypothetical protein
MGIKNIYTCLCFQASVFILKEEQLHLPCYLWTSSVESSAGCPTVTGGNLATDFFLHFSKLKYI